MGGGKVLHFYNDYTSTVSDAKYKSVHKQT